MRIIAGLYKGRRLKKLRGGIRPTSDRLREALFSYLGPSVVDSVWIDAFAGSGAIGLEALSRGAHFVYFNDQGRAAHSLLQANLKLCRIEEGFRVFRKEALQFLAQLDRNIPKESPSPLDFIYLDPPYQAGLAAKLLQTLANPSDRFKQATLLLEHFKKTDITVPSGWEVVRTLKAGDSWIEVLERK